MPDPRIHLVSVAGSTAELLRRLGDVSSAGLIEMVQRAVGDRFCVTGNETLIAQPEDDMHGGRFDDRQRAADIEEALADDEVAAVVSLRGGAWLTRILPDINFDLIERRSRPLLLMGFSELTTLVNVAGRYPQVIALYDLGPAFLYYGLKRYATRNAKTLADVTTDDEQQLAAFAHGYAESRFRKAFLEFFRGIATLLTGGGCPRTLEGRLVAGSLEPETPAVIVGGNLTLTVSLLGTRFASAVDAAGKWLALEDFNEPPYRIDRMLAQLKLAGAFDQCAGLLLGDFHLKNDDHLPAVLELLKYHLPRDRDLPVVARCNFGHTWPMAPIPINRQVTLHTNANNLTLTIPWSKWLPE